MTLTNERILEISTLLNEVGTVNNPMTGEPMKVHIKINTLLMFGISKNRVLLEPFAIPIRDTIRPPRDWTIFQEKRLNLCKKMALKDKDGKPEMEGRSYIFKDQEKFDVAIEKLKAKHKDAIDEFEEQQEKIREMFKEEFEIKYYEIKSKYLPDDIDPGIMNAIIQFLDGPPPEPKPKNEKEEKKEEDDES